MNLEFPGLIGKTLISRAQWMMYHWGIRAKRSEIPVPEKPFALWKKDGPGEAHKPKRRGRSGRER